MHWALHTVRVAQQCLHANCLQMIQKRQWSHNSLGATTVGTGETGPPTFRLGTNNVLPPQLFGRSFQKARNFTASIVTSQWDSQSFHINITPHSAYTLVDIQPATVERLRLRSSVVYYLCLLWTKMTCCMQFTCSIISIWLVFGSNNQGRNHGWKVKILELI